MEESASSPPTLIAHMSGEGEGHLLFPDAGELRSAMAVIIKEIAVETLVLSDQIPLEG